MIASVAASNHSNCSRLAFPTPLRPTPAPPPGNTTSANPRSVKTAENVPKAVGIEALNILLGQYDVRDSTRRIDVLSTLRGFSFRTSGLTFQDVLPPLPAMTRRSFASVACLALAATCLTRLAPSTAAADQPATFPVSSLSFARPASWDWVPSQSPMRKAVLKVPNTSGEAGEVIFFHFGPGNGGGTQANVERWFRQFREPKDQIKARTEEAKSGSAKVTYVLAEGTYLSGMPGGPQTPKPGFALLGAILEDPAGHIFIRFTGPKTVVDAGAADFRKMVESAKP